jgi:hypothetical protein
VNSKAANIRALLYQHPDGMGYAQLSSATGIARDKIAAHVASLMTGGDVKPFIVNGERLFKYVGDPAKVTQRDVQPQSRPAPIRVVNLCPDDAALETAQKEAAEAAYERCNPAVKPQDIPSFRSAPKESAVEEKPPATNGADLQALVIENIVSAAAHLAAMVRENVEDLDECPELARAVKGFELAEKIHEAARA